MKSRLPGGIAGADGRDVEPVHRTGVAARRSDLVGSTLIGALDFRP
jgi:hypothetical protein